MSKEEKTRQETYQYFNKKYDQEKVWREMNMEQESFRKKPLYKTLPEFYIGFFILLVFLS
jgi:hypothetical protein